MARRKKEDDYKEQEPLLTRTDFKHVKFSNSQLQFFKTIQKKYDNSLYWPGWNS